MYEGKWHHSEDGKECQPWAASVPNLEVKKLGTANNYCRDPFNLGTFNCLNAKKNTPRYIKQTNVSVE